jgi:surface antigen
MLIKLVLVSLTSVSLVLASCTSVPTREEQGVIIGGIVGGVLGHQIGDGSGQTLATIVGTLAGAAIGGSIGRNMDETDKLKAAHALETVRTGVSTAWVNPDSGYEYTFVPTQTVESGSGPCREYTMKAVIGDKTEKIYGTACRQADGSWLVQ